jgi:hypothetical protein
VAGYSIGMALTAINRKWAEASSLINEQRLVTASSFAVIAFCFLAAGLHSFEIQSLARWARVLS